MSNECAKCKSPHIYQDGSLWICPECSHEWTDQDIQNEIKAKEDSIIKDVNGKPLSDGDSVVVIKDLKIKGAGGGTVKGGTKVKNIRLTDAGDGHDIACKIPGLGSINLKSIYVKKA